MGFSKMFVCFPVKKKTQKREKCKDISVAIKLCKNNKSRKCMPQKIVAAGLKPVGMSTFSPGSNFFFKSSMGTPFLKDVNTPTYTQIKPMCVASLTQIQSNTEAYFLS